MSSFSGTFIISNPGIPCFTSSSIIAFVVPASVAPFAVAPWSPAAKLWPIPRAMRVVMCDNFKNYFSSGFSFLVSGAIAVLTAFSMRYFMKSPKLLIKRLIASNSGNIFPVRIAYIF